MVPFNKNYYGNSFVGKTMADLKNDFSENQFRIKELDMDLERLRLDDDIPLENKLSEMSCMYGEMTELKRHKRILGREIQSRKDGLKTISCL